MAVVPLYRERLTLEGATLAGCGAVGSAGLLTFVDAAPDNAASTIGQLAFVALLCSVLGPYLARRWTNRAEPVGERTISGDPTPLWQLPVITAVLALAVGLPAGSWDASLRVTGGCLLVGLTQAVPMAYLIRRDERRRARRYVRLPGSSLLRGTRLGFSEAGETGSPT